MASSLRARASPGQRSDAAISGLDYYGARYYDPRLGQFTSADSVLDGLNRYAYVGGNPETKTDPSGHGQRVGVPQAFAPPGNYGFSIDLSGLGSAIGGLLAATAGAGIAALTHSPAAHGSQYYAYYRGLDRRAAAYHSQTYSGVSGDELSRIHIPSGTPPMSSSVQIPTVTGIDLGLAAGLAGLLGNLHPPHHAAEPSRRYRYPVDYFSHLRHLG